MNTTHASLLRRVKDPHDEQSWREFVDVYEPIIYRYARLRGLSHENAKEIVQDVYTVLVKEMPKFDYHREQGRFKGWLKCIANNKINDMFKRRRPRVAETGEMTNAVQVENTPDDLWEDQWKRKHLRFYLRQILNEVSPKARQAFELHVVSGWSVERVVETLDISTSQVYTYKSRITQKLRERFESMQKRTIIQEPPEHPEP